MNKHYPIYTVEAQCQDCYKCVRHCPVKAIKIENAHAAVISERCIVCGNCVKVCPFKAKKIRDDTGRVKYMFVSGRPVYASLAPSWISEFSGIAPQNMIAALMKLGFAGVSETALGAQIVSERVADALADLARGLSISSACPVAVELLRTYLPEHVGCITPVLSPALTHCRMLKEAFGEQSRVVFIGPCIAKKLEADRQPALMDAALTFQELRLLFEQAGIDPAALDTGSGDYRFSLATADEGVLYPVEGGMIETIRAHGTCEHVRCAALTGISVIEQALKGSSPEDIDIPVFLETLACFGGCIYGPGTTHASPGLIERLRIFDNARMPASIPSRAGNLNISSAYERRAPDEPSPAFDERALSMALRSIGKLQPEDELNCGGCGYDSCRKLAAALLAGSAEISMCVSFMRKQAQKKANALLRCIPSGVVIVNAGLEIVECNRHFAEIFGAQATASYDAAPGLAGADLRPIVPFYDLFATALNTGADIHRDSFKSGEQLLNITLFTIEPQQIVGAVIADVTPAELKREQIARRADEVIRKNLATVQDIACRLGEHMAETEMLLRSISQDYAAREEAPFTDRSAGSKQDGSDA
ncbi:MAG: 4Fe-4S dicluster domain-containing protein [Deltaproteobacteria bacterium]|nr:4Fe-4S dicluster domain-containing protein [Deltaproteobacteria bacterium]